MKSGTPLTATTLGQFLKSVVGAPWSSFLTEEQAVELAAKDSKRVHAILREAFGQKKDPGGWIDELVAAENAAHQVFFGQTFDLDLFRQTLENCGEEQVREWAGLKLEPHFLPEVVFTPESDFPGWEVKPSDWYWQNFSAGKLKRLSLTGELIETREAKLEGAVVLIDTRLKPKYQDGKQMFVGDREFLGKIISSLRQEGKLARYEYGPQSSRFGISADEWQEHLKPKVAEKLNLELNQVRLELALEANVIPQLYPHLPRANDGTTNTWFWYEEYFEGLARRLSGGYSDGGGLSRIEWSDSGDRWLSRAVRPLGVLAGAQPSGA